VPQEDHVAAARAVYDVAAAQYVQFTGTEISAATEGPIERSLLAAFVELVTTGRGSRVADVGCGPGRVASFLATHGLDVVGLDVSRAMLEAARRAHPAIQFQEGRLDELPLGDRSVNGVVCWYSIIYTPPDRLDDAFAELRRVIDGDGLLMLAFQAGSGDPMLRPDAHGTKLTLTSYHHDLADVTRRLERAAFDVHATAVREPEFDHESTPQAFVIARSERSPRGS
jgi:ubiquinone/menaquinone biosynthesis C-methylase UbiE